MLTFFSYCNGSHQLGWLYTTYEYQNTIKFKEQRNNQEERWSVELLIVNYEQLKIRTILINGSYMIEI